MSASHLITHWNPEDRAFWAAHGQHLARRNLALSVAALMLAFAVWMLWSVVVVRLPELGFRYSTNQLFWLAALPGFSGATLRVVYAFAVPLFGGRRWTAISTLLLLLPALGTGIAVQDLNTPYETMVLLAVLCGLGGGNFASSMANISFFYPQAQMGRVLGLNAGLGNLGVPLAQWLVPLAIGTALPLALVGQPQAGSGGQLLWLQNAGLVWVPLIVACAAAAWFGMHDLAAARGSFAEQAGVFTRAHTWRMCWLQLGSFGSFIGLAAGLPLLLDQEFPQLDSLQLAWVGPLAGALARPLGGWLADRHGGARITLWAFIAMACATLVLLACLPSAGQTGGSAAQVSAFLLACLLLFVASGLANGSTFRMIPLIFLAEHLRQADAQPAAQDRARGEANKEAAAALGLASALGAYGGFFIPKSFGTSIALTGGLQSALLVFLAFYLSCIAITWWHHARRYAPLPC